MRKINRKIAAKRVMEYTSTTVKNWEKLAWFYAIDH